jgi:hypothetical protein
MSWQQRFTAMWTAQKMYVVCMRYARGTGTATCVSCWNATDGEDGMWTNADAGLTVFVYVVYVIGALVATHYIRKVVRDERTARVEVDVQRARQHSQYTQLDSITLDV